MVLAYKFHLPNKSLGIIILVSLLNFYDRFKGCWMYGAMIMTHFFIDSRRTSSENILDRPNDGAMLSNQANRSDSKLRGHVLGPYAPSQCITS